MIKSKGYAAPRAHAALEPFEFERREPRPTDVVIEISHCGICHSDLHEVRAEWNQHGIFPMVPGHEIVGVVQRVGSAVTRFKAGDRVGVGCMVDSCRECDACKRGLEQYCAQGCTVTYNGRERDTKAPTYGGYSNNLVVDEAFTLRIPARLDQAAAAPLLCAGITTYSPLRHWQVGPGKRVGIVGLGGLGHVGLKIARAMGAEVTLFTSSPRKVDEGKRLGAHEVVVSSEREQMKKQRGRFDFILDTVSAVHDYNALLKLLKVDGTLTLVGLPDQKLAPPDINQLIWMRRQLAGSMIGGIAETQEMLDFCAQHGVAPEIEKITLPEVNTALERLAKSDVKYRFVIEMGR